jgi:hypothetical protein
MPLSPREINVLLALLDETPASVATSIGEDRTAVWRTIHRERPNLRIRKKISQHLAEKVSHIFEDQPLEEIH